MLICSQIRSAALFWDIEQHRVVISYQSIGTAYWCHLLEDGTDRLSWNVSTELPLYVVWYPRKVQISSTLQRKPGITNFSQAIQIPHTVVQKLFYRPAIKLVSEANPVKMKTVTFPEKQSQSQSHKIRHTK